MGVLLVQVEYLFEKEKAPVSLRQAPGFINKAQAYLHLHDLDQGIALSLKGLQLAAEYRSKRHIGWVEKSYNRLRVLPIGKEKKLDTLRDALLEAQKKVE